MKFAVLALCICALPALVGQELQTVQVATGIAAPTDIQNAGDGSGRLFLVEQAGVIRILRNGAVLAQPFLNISARVTCCGERGLLGLAFPPGYASSGRFYVNYINTAGNTVIAQYRVSANPDMANPASEIILLTITQPAFTNHKGGQLRFGRDGYLYIATGDGGSGGDPLNHGQNLGSLLGKILRVDVEGLPGQLRVPPQNPFVNTPGARGEIWAYGLRNPWRFSFDRANGDMFIGDVGQSAFEEIDYQPAASQGGENYGWRLMEGLHCFNPSNCNQQGLTLPVLEYSQTNGACSVTGGFVYRGVASPGLRGTYIYGDYCNGRISGLERQGSQWVNRLLLASGFLITTFGEDEAGEIYVADGGSGRIYRLQGNGAPRFVSSAVTNAASFQSGMVAGSLATVFVSGVMDDPGILEITTFPLPFSLGGVSMTVDGIPAPILAVANQNGVEQVNFQVPWEIAGRTQAPVIVTRNGVSSAPAGVVVMAHQPGVFTTDGVQAVAVHNANYTLVTQASPLEGGEFAFVYVEGIGPVSNQPPTSAAAPEDPLSWAQANVTVTLGGIPCDVPFAGLAPRFVGLYQLNFRVPSGLAPGWYGLAVSVAGVNAPVVQVPVH